MILYELVCGQIQVAPGQTTSECIQESLLAKHKSKEVSDDLFGLFGAFPVVHNVMHDTMLSIRASILST
eukprot:SAG22_NODE_2202_length_2843_cov_2.716108_3_plen_69_part_00